MRINQRTLTALVITFTWYASLFLCPASAALPNIVVIPAVAMAHCAQITEADMKMAAQKLSKKTLKAMSKTAKIRRCIQGRK